MSNVDVPLRVPLYQEELKRSPPNPQKSPKLYLPPYRYDDNESNHNVYISSDEAYGNVARALLFQHEQDKDEYEPYDTVIKTLAISQIKMFADAHMEKALKLPTFPERGESANVTLLRRVDVVFGSVLFEFFASKDGILLGPQVESLTKREKRIEEMKRDNFSPKKKIRQMVNKSESIAESHASIVLSPKSCRRSDISKHGGSKIGTVQARGASASRVNSFDNRYENSFDRIYDACVETENSFQDPSPSYSYSAASFTSGSKIRQEILTEITQLKNIMKSTDSDVEKQRYKDHINNLVDELDKFNNISHVKEVEIPEAGMATTNREISQTETTTSMARRNDEVPKDITKQHTKSDHEKVEVKTEERAIHPLHMNEAKIRSKGFVHIKDVERGFRFATVIAHKDMNDGVLFQAEYRGSYFTVRVPHRGVKKDEVFSTPMLHPSGVKDTLVRYESFLDGMKIPQGRWRDGLFNCFNDPLLLHSCFCPNVALSQVRTRMKFQDEGEITSNKKVKYLIGFNGFVLLFNVWTALVLFFVFDNPKIWVVLLCIIPVATVDLALIFGFLSLTMKTRREVKKRYKIKNDKFKGFNEAVLIHFCSCLVVSQMGRHTADYSTFREEPFSSTGLPNHLEILKPIVLGEMIEERNEDKIGDELLC